MATMMARQRGPAFVEEPSLGLEHPAETACNKDHRRAQLRKWKPTSA